MVTTAYTRAILAPERDVFGLVFIELTHPALPGGIQVVNDISAVDESTQANVPYVWNGKTWVAYPFDFAPATDVDGVPETRIRIQNVDRKIGKAVDAAGVEAIQLSSTILSSADFELNGAGTRMVVVGTPTVQRQWPIGFLRTIDRDRREVTGVIKGWDITREPYPFMRATPSIAPGLWI